jgi:hypothetical protein
MIPTRNRSASAPLPSTKKIYPCAGRNEKCTIRPGHIQILLPCGHPPARPLCATGYRTCTLTPENPQAVPGHIKVTLCALLPKLICGDTLDRLKSGCVWRGHPAQTGRFQQPDSTSRGPVTFRGQLRCTRVRHPASPNCLILKRFFKYRETISPGLRIDEVNRCGPVDCPDWPAAKQTGHPTPSHRPGCSTSTKLPDKPTKP